MTPRLFPASVSFRSAAIICLDVMSCVWFIVHTCDKGSIRRNAAVELLHINTEGGSPVEDVVPEAGLTVTSREVQAI